MPTMFNKNYNHAQLRVPLSTAIETPGGMMILRSLPKSFRISCCTIDDSENPPARNMYSIPETRVKTALEIFVLLTIYAFYIHVSHYEKRTFGKKCFRVIKVLVFTDIYRKTLVKMKRQGWNWWNCVVTHTCTRYLSLHLPTSRGSFKTSPIACLMRLTVGRNNLRITAGDSRSMPLEVHVTSGSPCFLTTVSTDVPYPKKNKLWLDELVLLIIKDERTCEIKIQP